MVLVMICWMAAMASGLLWGRLWTGVLTAATLLAALATRPASLAQWESWLQLLTLGATPWLLAAQRTREERLLKTLHASEAGQMSRLSEAARSLLSLQSSTQQMETDITQISDVYHVTKETVRALRLAELFGACANVTPRLLDARGLRLIDLSEPAPQVLRASRATDGRMSVGTAPEGSAGSANGNHLLDVEQALVARVTASGQAACASAQELSCPVPEGLSRLAWAPLWREQKAIGVLVADELPEAQLPTLGIIANQLSLQLSRIHLYQQVEALAVTDALTGLFVRRHFLERAREELVRSSRHGLACTALMVDLDRFKEKNDTYGHLVGDVILRDVARLLQRNLRDIDLIARYGGEEFILLLVDTSAEQAMPIAQRLKQLVEVHPIRAYDELVAQTISVGVAGFPEDAKTLEELIERADQALYAAKRAGRNQVVRWAARAGA